MRAVGKRALKLMCRCLPAAMAPAVGRALLPMLLPAHPAGRKMAYHALANVRALPSSVTLLQGVSAAAKDELSHKHRAAAQLTDAQTCSKASLGNSGVRLFSSLETLVSTSDNHQGLWRPWNENDPYEHYAGC